MTEENGYFPPRLSEDLKDSDFASKSLITVTWARLARLVLENGISPALSGRLERNTWVRVELSEANSRLVPRDVGSGDSVVFVDL